MFVKVKFKSFKFNNDRNILGQDSREIGVHFSMCQFVLQKYACWRFLRSHMARGASNVSFKINISAVFCLNIFFLISNISPFGRMQYDYCHGC